MILIFILGLVALRILYSVGEVYYERDWPRDTWKGLLIALGVLCIAVSAFGQAARVDIPLQTSWAECSHFWRSIASSIVGCKRGGLPLHTSEHYAGSLSSGSDHHLHGFYGRDDLPNCNAACSIAGEYLHGCNGNNGKRRFLVWRRSV